MFDCTIKAKCTAPDGRGDVRVFVHCDKRGDFQFPMRTSSDAISIVNKKDDKLVEELDRVGLENEGPRPTWDASQTRSYLDANDVKYDPKSHHKTLLKLARQHFEKSQGGGK